jgi:hypothetical protein
MAKGQHHKGRGEKSTYQANGGTTRGNYIPHQPKHAAPAKPGIVDRLFGWRKMK